jgi:hypothetical protein
VQLTVVTPDRKYTVSLNALAIGLKADFLIEIKICAWCRNQFVSTAAHQQFCKPACRKTAFRKRRSMTRCQGDPYTTSPLKMSSCEQGFDRVDFDVRPQALEANALLFFNDYRRSSVYTSGHKNSEDTDEQKTVSCGWIGRCNERRLQCGDDQARTYRTNWSDCHSRTQRNACFQPPEC